MQQTPYEILGQSGIKALVSEFYDAMDELPEAQTIRAMHAPELSKVKSMLAAYLTGWMGGPPVYTAVKGTVCLTETHAPYHIGEAERDQWLHCMNVALEKIGASDELKVMLRDPLYRVADTVRNDNAPPQAPDDDPNIIARG